MDIGSNDTTKNSPASFGIANDVRQLKESGSASIAELREFFRTLKAKNPQEVIGIVSTSLLIQSLALSTVLTVAIMAVFTVGPYLVYGPPQPKTAAAKPASSAKPAATADTNAATANPTANASTPAASSTPGQPDAAAAAKVMGLDETKNADPKKNPRDNPDLDKLLDGL